MSNTTADWILLTAVLVAMIAVILAGLVDMGVGNPSAETAKAAKLAMNYVVAALGASLLLPALVNIIKALAATP